MINDDRVVFDILCMISLRCMIPTLRPRTHAKGILL